MKKYLVKPGQKVDLDKWDANEDGGIADGKTASQEEFSMLNEKLEHLQELLYAESKHRVLIVLQAIDSGGKDGTIRHVFDGVNPQGVKVASFKKPTSNELAHDYLWRVHPHVPGNGEIVIFNRSHYEDVLVVRVHKMVPEVKLKKRYDHINAFEKMLTDEGTTIVKFFLHIDKDEQKERLQKRLDNPDKNWKFDVNDLAERKLWDEYQTAFQYMLEETSTDWAPWHIIPANRKWFRNLLISRILIETLEGLNMSYPLPPEDIRSIIVE